MSSVRLCIALVLLTNVTGLPTHAKINVNKINAAPDDPGMLDILTMHNLYRCRHGVPPLEWDANLAQNAQKWAAQGVYAHSPAESRILDGVQIGENLAWGFPMRNGINFTKAWYCEIDCCAGEKF